MPSERVRDSKHRLDASYAYTLMHLNTGQFQGICQHRNCRYCGLKATLVNNIAVAASEKNAPTMVAVDGVDGVDVIAALTPLDLHASVPACGCCYCVYCSSDLH